MSKSALQGCLLFGAGAVVEAIVEAVAITVAITVGEAWSLSCVSGFSTVEWRHVSSLNGHEYEYGLVLKSCWVGELLKVLLLEVEWV